MIAVTATVEYDIAEWARIAREVSRPRNRTDAPDRAELAWISGEITPGAAIVFEAISPKGVILGTANGIFGAVKGSKLATVSAKITLSPEEIQRVKTVSVRWE